ncbi:hypothetical protein KC946_01470 [Candidatus Saccharibacteria bacterium]|nr:hypothetical protein [Candidatus Saccharibacteria bacterium]
MSIIHLSCEQHIEHSVFSDAVHISFFTPPTDPENTIEHPDYGEGSAYITAQCPEDPNETLLTLINTQPKFDVLQMMGLATSVIYLNDTIDPPKPTIQPNQAN